MKVIKYGKLIGTYYKSENSNNKLIIVGLGAPNLIDVDNLRNVKILNNAGYDVMVPDYYGFCRSEGKFTPYNSIKTLIDTKEFCKNGTAISIYTQENIKLNYKEFIFLGLSYGGRVTLILPKYDPSIDKIGVFYPVTDYLSFGKRGVKEETVEDFLYSTKTGFSTIYRGINLPIWQKQFTNQTPYIPINNTQYLNNTSIFFAHGTKDISIYYKKTKEFYESLGDFNKKNNNIYKQYQNCGHGEETMIPASKDFIKWLNQID